MYSKEEIGGVTECVRNYVDGVVQFDFEKGERAWHPEGLKISLDSQSRKLVTNTILETRPAIAKEEIDAIKKKTFQEGVIQSVDIAGNAAAVKLVWNFKRDEMKKIITDYVLLLRGGDGWKIVAKIFDEQVLDE